MAKMDRYSIGQRVFDSLINLIVVVAQAQYQTKQTKLITLRSVVPQLDTSKILIRLARQLEIIDEPSYIRYEEVLHGIGKMLGGWIRDLENKQA